MESNGDLKPFIKKAMDWVKNIDDLNEFDHQRIESYLKSEKFYAVAVAIKEKAKSQEELNIELTNLVSIKISEAQAGH